ncbi:MAG: alanine racemase [Alphaproteobacteria bacterium]|nr:alanine racemase [Alphaproteobacteria bacterium]
MSHKRQGSDLSRAVLTVNLGAIADNFRNLSSRLAPACQAGAVVKANAYGLGFEEVSKALAKAGCRHFFVADLEEGIALRRVLDKADIFVFNGPERNSEPVFDEHSLTPILNTPGQIESWSAFVASKGSRGAVIQVDTGMSRTGLDMAYLEQLAEDHKKLDGMELKFLMSHLACADEPGHPLNARQLDEFSRARSLLGEPPGSLANSSGIFLGTDYHFDLVRTGGALYGMNPVPNADNPMDSVVKLEAPILQLRDVDSPITVGYGASSRVEGPGRIATVAVGYADGYLRSLSNKGSAFVNGVRVPVIGRVSMDYITLDVSKVPEDKIHPGSVVELIGPHHGIDALAEEAGTLAYEILTGLGARYTRAYCGGSA